MLITSIKTELHRIAFLCQIRIRLRNIHFIFSITFTIDLAIDQCDPIDRSTRRFAPIEVPAYNYFPRSHAHMFVYLSIAKKWEREKIAVGCAVISVGYYIDSFVVDARARVPEINRPRLLPVSHGENYDKAEVGREQSAESSCRRSIKSRRQYFFTSIVNYVHKYTKVPRKTYQTRMSGSHAKT